MVSTRIASLYLIGNLRVENLLGITLEQNGRRLTIDGKTTRQEAQLREVLSERRRAEHRQTRDNTEEAGNETPTPQPRVADVTPTRRPTGENPLQNIHATHPTCGATLRRGLALDHAPNPVPHLQEPQFTAPVAPKECNDAGYHRQRAQAYDSRATGHPEGGSEGLK